MERLTVQVTFETEIAVDVPSGCDAEEYLYKQGTRVADTLDSITSADSSGEYRWDVNIAEVSSENGFIGDYWY